MIKETKEQKTNKRVIIDSFFQETRKRGTDAELINKFHVKPYSANYNLGGRKYAARKGGSK